MRVHGGVVSSKDENESRYKRSDHKRDNERPTSKLVGDGPVETATLAELGRPDPDAATVTQFVDSVENVDDIETDFDGCLLSDLDPARQVDVERFVGMVFLGVRETPA